jgi:hypothetical protein
MFNSIKLIEEDVSMRKMTQHNLEDAFAGESQAHMRYLIFAEVAEKDVYANLKLDQFSTPC